MARLRLVHGRERPATVYLLTNLPLNLEVAELTTWNALMRDREAEACHRWAGVWLAQPSEQSRCAPDLWATPMAAKSGDGGKGCQTPLIYILEHFDTPFPPYPAWGSTSLNRDAATLVEYRRPGSAARRTGPTSLVSYGASSPLMPISKRSQVRSPA